MSDTVVLGIVRKQAVKAVNLIVADLSDRRGLSGEWDQIDDDIKREIKSRWVDILVTGK